MKIVHIEYPQIRLHDGATPEFISHCIERAKEKCKWYAAVDILNKNNQFSLEAAEVLMRRLDVRLIELPSKRPNRLACKGEVF